jgi:probable rRNA maturation factor
MSLDLAIQRSSESGSIPQDEQFLAWAQAALAGREGGYSLAIRVVDEDEALRYNRDYRGKDYAANVLSFPAELPDGLPEELRESQFGQQLPEADHWAHLVIHGVLHLMDYDHQQDDDAAVMEALETKILVGLGIPDPYRDGR